MTTPPPHNANAECIVLGCILLDNATLDQVRAVLVEDDFYREAHRVIYRAILALAARNEPFDLVTVNDLLTTEGTIGSVGGAVYLSAMTDNIPSVTAANINAHARVIRTHALRRRMLTDAQQLASDIGEGTVGISAACSRLRQTAAAVESRTSTATVEDRHRRWCGKLDRNLDGQGPFVSTGFEALDNVLGEGLAPGRISIWAGRPGMGKTSMMSALAINLARAGMSIVAFPNETGEQAFTDMMVCAELGIETKRLTKGRKVANPITDDERF